MGCRVFTPFSVALAVVALVWLHSLSKRVDRLQRRIDEAGIPGVSPVGRAEAVPGSEAEAEREKGPGAISRAHRTEPSRGGLLGRLRGKARRRERPADPAVRPNWMVWLGGISVALAGVFLVKYSIEQGLLTPWARVAVALAAGIAMHALSEFLVRKTGRGHPAFAALAAAGSITLSAAALGALHLYELVPPLVAFAFLAAVSLATMALALRHGPVLAALGLMGGYAVPVLVGGDSDRALEVLVYSLIVSAAALLTVRYLRRAWIWWGVLAGSLFWWLASVGANSAHGYRGFYLALVAFALIHLPEVEWRQWLGLRPGPAPAAGRAASQRGAAGMQLTLGLLLLVLAQGVSIATEPFSALSAAGWLPLVVALFAAARLRRVPGALLWGSLAVQAAGWLAAGLSLRRSGLGWESKFAADAAGLAVYAACSAALYTALACWSLRSRPSSPVWGALATASPVCWLAVAYALSTDAAVSRAWAAAGVSLGLCYTAAGWALARSRLAAVAPWCVVGCSAAYSLAVAMLFRDAGLTLALALQAAPLAWIAGRFGTVLVSWMTKGVLAAVVARLTLNPSLPAYSEGEHWTLWTYGGSTLAATLAGWLARPVPRLRRWIEAGAAHLLVLTGWVVTRDFVYDGDVFSADYGFREASIHTAVWGALGLVYYLRSQASGHVGPVYLWAGRLLLSMSLANYCLVLFVLNPFVTHEPFTDTRIWNGLLLAFGAPVLLACLATRVCERRGARIAGPVAAVALFAFVSFEIRHLWQAGLSSVQPASDGEMATYSVVWLAMAVAGVLAGGLRYGQRVYRVGMALLAVTVCKVFLFDMSGLTGLLRAGSFMGLGLSLLALAYLHQRFARSAAAPGGTAS